MSPVQPTGALTALAELMHGAALGVDWLWECDAQGLLTQVLPAGAQPAAACADWTPGRPLPGGPCVDETGRLQKPLVHGADRLHPGQPLPRSRVAWRDAAGRSRVLVLAGAPMADGQGRFCGWRGHAQDVTESVARCARAGTGEQHWRAAVAAAGMALMDVHPQARSVTLDARSAALHGLAAEYPDGGTVRLSQLQACLPERDRDALSAAFGRARQPGSAPAPVRYRVRSSDACVGLVLVQGEGGDGALHGLCVDLSVQAEVLELRRQKAAAEQASRAKTRFLSRAGQALRTPLHALLGFAQMLSQSQGSLLDAEQARHVALLQQAGQQLQGLIDDMLDVQCIEEGGRPLDLVTVDLGAALHRALALLQPQAERRQLRVELKVLSHRTGVRADAAALDQVLLNLLSNGVKYNKPGGRLRVSVQRQGERLRLDVRDDGPGLSEEQQRGLFQPFNRLGAESGNVPGTGLGLVISHGLAVAMGGQLMVGSQPRQGSCFTLLLGAAAALASPHAAAAPALAVVATPSTAVPHHGDDPVRTAQPAHRVAARG